MTAIAAAWNRFWFDEVPSATLALFRLAFGVVATLWTLSLASDLRTFFTADGIVPEAPATQYWIGVFDVSSSWPVVVAAFAVLLASCVALTVGWHTRVAAVIVFVGILSFERRTPNVFNSGDTLVRNLALYLALAPAGIAVSLDRWRRDRASFWAFPMHAVWPLRLVQIHLTVMYLTTVWAKVRGDVWNDGTAISYALRLDDLTRFAAPDFFVTSEAWSNLLTWGTLAVELALAVLVWNRRARPWVLLAGVALHLSIELTIHVGFFSMAVLTAYLAFVAPETAARFLERVRLRLSRARLRPASRIAAAGRAADVRTPVGTRR